jgi:hypothetical protein
MLRRPLFGMALAAIVLPLPAPAQPLPLAEEVPFITTPDNVTLALLRLARVRPGDHVIDLGSGDGRIVITAARRFGAGGLGVEIVPDLVARSLSRASVVTMYLLPEVNLQLRPALLKLAPGTRIVSHDWDMGDWLPDETLVVDAPDKTIGREKKSRLLRWVVPAPVAGLWCGDGGWQMQISQQYQFVQVRWQQGPRGWALPGRLDGAGLQLLGAAPGPLRWQARGDELVAGKRRLRRSAGEAC